jgi:hypothetical protein
MGPPSYMRSVVDRNLVMRRILAMLSGETVVQYFANHADCHSRNCVRKMQKERCAEIPIARSPRPLNLVTWRLKFVYPQYGSYFMSSFWHLEF